VTARRGASHGRAARAGGAAATLAAAAALVCARPAWAQQIPAPERLPGPEVRPTTPRPPAPTRADSARAARSGRGAPIACRGQPISDVVVLSQPPLGNAILGRFRWLQRRATALHATTDESVIRRFLLLNPGEPCDELRRSESERILRAQPYLVDARVLAYDDGAGGVRLEIETRDEFSVILGVAAFAGGGAPPVSTVRLGEANLMGRAVYAMGQWRDGGRGYRDAFVARTVLYQLFGRPYQLALLGERRDLGGQWAVDAAHPFYTDLQRVAWRAAGGAADEYVELLRPGADRNALRYTRSHGTLGGLLRVGTPGRLSLFGGSLSYERADTRDWVNVIGPDGIRPDSGLPLGFVPAARYPAQRVARANALWGLRAVTFVRATGFESLTGVQDVRRGFQVSTMVGRSVALLGTRDDDYFVSGNAYMGVGGTRSFVASEVRGEARHDNGANEWRGLVVGGRSAWYFVPNERWRFLTSADYTGVWRPRVPIQVQLGAREGGVRGYAGALEAGSARAVLRAESRVVLGSLGNVGDLGLAAFTDAGKLWAGSAPYGVNSPVRASVGLGALGAFPRNSRRLWRVDVARALTRVPGVPQYQLIFENRDLTRLFWREPRDVEMGRERAAPASVFNWP
jgi:hypothetical protein